MQQFLPTKKKYSFSTFRAHFVNIRSCMRYGDFFFSFDILLTVHLNIFILILTNLMHWIL